MKKRSTLLKVISVLLIIFGVISLIGDIALIAVGDKLASLAQTESVATGSLVMGIIGAVAEIVAGVVGLQYKSRQNVLIWGCVILVLALINMVMTVVSDGFSASSILGLVIPLLFLWGGYQSN